MSQKNGDSKPRVRENLFIVDDNVEHSIEDISLMPTTLENIHESCFRCYHVMHLILEMLKRGDSADTITMVVKHLGLRQVETEFTRAGTE